MRYPLPLLFRLIIICLFCAGVPANVAQAAISVKDGAGHTVTLSQPARRIVSLAPHTTENLFAAGAGAYVVVSVLGGVAAVAAGTLAAQAAMGGRA